MKALSKNDVKVLGVLVDWGQKIEVEEWIEDGTVVINTGITRSYEDGIDPITLHETVIKNLNKRIPKAGTPNAELTDEQKGLIQLLFEVEKALA